MKLYVGNLSYRTSQEEIQEAFGRYGEVSSVEIISDHETGRSKGFGFVEMPNDGEAKKAIDAFDGQPFGERTLKVNEARPKEARPPRRDFGGGGGGYRGGDRGFDRGDRRPRRDRDSY